MQIHRYFVPDLSPAGGATLDESESRHATRVLRCQIGDRVIAFDGRGGEALCHVSSIAKNSVQLEIVERLDTNRELPCNLTLVVALPKGDRQKTLVEMVTQIGVHRLVPLETERGVAQPSQSALERLRRTVIEASKQCGRNRLMEIADPMRVDRLAAEAVSGPADSTCLVAHPNSDAQGVAATTFPLPSTTVATQLAIGPEGGFTDVEMEALLRAGWRQVTLGRAILRVETAAVAAAAWLAQWMNTAGTTGKECHGSDQ